MCILIFFKDLIEFITIWLLFYVFWLFGRKACGILAPRSGIEFAPPALGGEVLTIPLPGKFFITCIVKIILKKKNHLERRSVDFINHPRDSFVIHKWGRNPVRQTGGSGLEKLTLAQGHPGGSQVQLGQTWPRSGVTSLVQRMALVSTGSWCVCREAPQDHCERNEDALVPAPKSKAQVTICGRKVQPSPHSHFSGGALVSRSSLASVRLLSEDPSTAETQGGLWCLLRHLNPQVWDGGSVHPIKPLSLLADD